MYTVYTRTNTHTHVHAHDVYCNQHRHWICLGHNGWTRCFVNFVGNIILSNLRRSFKNSFLFVQSCESVLCLGCVCRPGYKIDVSAMSGPRGCVSLEQHWSASHHASHIPFRCYSWSIWQESTLSCAETVSPLSVCRGAEVLRRIEVEGLEEVITAVVTGRAPMPLLRQSMSLTSLSSMDRG